jgi:hypothetical protein
MTNLHKEGSFVESKLPAEIIEHIVSYLNTPGRDRLKNLKHCSLVCRAWLPVIRRPIFSAWTIPRPKLPGPTVDLPAGQSDVLNDARNVTPYVVRLYIEPMAVMDQTHLLYHLPETFPNISELLVSLYRADAERLFLTMSLDRFPRLNRLHLQLAGENRFTGIQFPTALTLSVLSLHYADLPIWKALAHTSTAGILRRLSLHRASSGFAPHQAWSVFASYLMLFPGLEYLEIEWNFDCETGDRIDAIEATVIGQFACASPSRFQRMLTSLL